MLWLRQSVRSSVRNGPVRGPRRARRGDCQEPWTGRDARMRSTPVLETSGRPSLWRTAGPTRQDILAWEVAGDGRGLWGTAGDCG